MSVEIPVALSGMTPAVSYIQSQSEWSIIRPLKFDIQMLESSNEPVLLFCLPYTEKYDSRLTVLNEQEVVINGQIFIISRRLKFNHSNYLCVWI